METPKIQVLDQDTIGKIAAGEVIERPLSVAKELVENAIDAGATAITVEMKEGGIRLLRVTDNGCGIAAEDVRTAFLEHATSKIRSTLDLLSIRSLGFRGEALPSIAAVSRTELITKTAGSLTGVRILMEGGKELSFEEVGAPEGTT
ncbi:MAG: ATP-binding protein, partial [Lachnospiraceae bacterium]|nr:ATP-binding protein [Lachnospiraceae bacterium]